MAVFNPSLEDFYDLPRRPRSLERDHVEVPEAAHAGAVREFDHWLDRLAFNKQIELLAPTERDARVIGAAHRSGKPVIQRAVTPEAAPAERARTVDQYLALRGESREARSTASSTASARPARQRSIDETPRRFRGPSRSRRPLNPLH